MQDERTEEIPQAVGTHTDPAITLQVGATLSVDAFTASGLLLLSAGHTIEDCYQLSRLLDADVLFGSYSQRKPQADLTQLVRAGSMPSIPRAFHQSYAVRSEAVDRVRNVFERIEVSGDLDVGAAQDTVRDLMDRVVSDGLALAALTQIKGADTYTYSHSVNVCVLSMYLALATRYKDRIKQIGLGGLLHDVGKLMVPKELLHRNGPLNDAERRVMQRHPGAGVRIVQSAGCWDPIVLACVHDHHEKLTGRGYPRRKSASQISAYAKIVSLADVFDALTTDRPYRPAMTPEAALVLMVEEMGDNFDPWLLKRFIEVAGNIADQTHVTPDGHIVLKTISPSASGRRPARKPPADLGLDNAA